jgi:hypothetical protein
VNDDIDFLNNLGQDLQAVAAREATKPAPRRWLRSATPIALIPVAVAAILVATWAVTRSDHKPGRLVGVHHPGTSRPTPPAGMLGGPPAIPRGPVLASVSAISPDDIWAAGSTTTNSFSPRSVLLHYDGTSWTPTPAPNIGQLRGLAAIAPDDVWALGGGVLHWDGTDWSRVPLPKVSYTDLNAISASGPNDIWVVGTRGVQLSPHHIGRGTLAEHWDGSKWTVVPTPNPNHQFSDLIDVLTLSPTDAWLVGQATRGITMHWDGTRWTLVTLPAALNGHGQMWGIGTDGQGGVWALGDGRGTGYGKALYLRWTGRAWRLVPGTATGESTSPSAVSGSSSSDIWAIGSAAGDRYMIARYGDGGWQNIDATVPGVPRDAINLGDVETLAPNDAWAVGQATSYQQRNGARQPRLDVVILHWNGTDWTPVAVPGIASVGGP